MPLHPQSSQLGLNSWTFLVRGSHVNHCTSGEVRSNWTLHVWKRCHIISENATSGLLTCPTIKSKLTALKASNRGQFDGLTPCNLSVPVIRQMLRHRNQNKMYLIYSVPSLYQRYRWAKTNWPFPPVYWHVHYLGLSGMNVPVRQPCGYRITQVCTLPAAKLCTVSTCGTTV